MEDKYKKFLDMVLGKIINDTVFDRNSNKIMFPFYRVLDTPIRQPLSHTIFYPFITYCINIYGLTNQESQILWYKYEKVIHDWLYNDLNINESVKPYSDISDKNKKYLDTVVDFIVRETIIDTIEGKIVYPFLFSDPHYFPSYLVPLEPVFHTPLSFTKYCEHQFGVNRDELVYVWGKYKNIILDKINNPSIISESEERIQKYLNTVIGFILNSTVVNEETETLNIPGLDSKIPFMAITKFFDNLIGLVLPPPPAWFRRYCKNNYALKDDEVDYVWGIIFQELYKTIMDILSKKSQNIEPINESVDKQRKYLDRVVNHLVSDTIVDPVWFSPPYNKDKSNFKQLFLDTFGLLKNNFYSGLESNMIYFKHYVNLTYGLSYDEVPIVWREYMIKLNEKGGYNLPIDR